MNKKFLIILFLLLCASVSMYSYSVIVVLIQDDSTQTELRTTSRAIEDGLLGSFFDNGVIVSTEPIITEPQDAATVQKLIKLASQGRVNYILCLRVEYVKTASDTPNLMQLSDIASFKWELYDSSGDSKIAQSTYTPDPKSLIVDGEFETRIALEKICNALRTDIHTVIEEDRGLE